MSKSVKIIMGLALLTVVSACGQRNEEVVYADPAPAPIAAEPTYSKY
ncbi:hypothetical protein [Palleronia sp.]